MSKDKDLRHGVKLSPQLADIFDECHADMTLDRLCLIFYSDKPRHAAANCIKVQVHQINGLLKETDWAIRSNGKRPPTYRVVNVRPPLRVANPRCYFANLRPNARN
jgi:hypothetical protein